MEVFGLGQCSLDRLGVVAGYPAPDEKAEFDGLVTVCGGPVATALCTPIWIAASRAEPVTDGSPFRWTAASAVTSRPHPGAPDTESA